MEKKLAEIIIQNPEYIKRYNEMFEHLETLKKRLDKETLIIGRVENLSMIKSQIKSHIEDMNLFIKKIYNNKEEEL